MLPSLNAPELLWQNGQPFSAQFNDPYFSKENGLAESRYVFLQQNHLEKRWQDWPWNTQPSFTIVETGFGTGLNFLLTWQAWRARSHNHGWLHFTSIEKYPLSHEQLRQALSLWPELAELAELLLKNYPLPIKGMQHIQFAQERISLSLYFDDIEQALPQLTAPVHAWYLDGFAPARNPQMWSQSLFKTLRLLSKPHTTLATFTAAGEIKRGLIGAGFTVEKIKGYGSKRDMLRAVYTQSLGPERPAYFYLKPWLISDANPGAEVTVIGAGLAGASTARALAERGVKVTVLDKLGIARGGSGNPQGGLYIKLAADDNALHSEFYLSAYQYALTFLNRHLGNASASNANWQQCGMIQLAFDEKEAARQQLFLKNQPLPDALLQAQDASTISAQIGSDLPLSGLVFPQGGWLNPVVLCERLLAHPNIHFERCDVLRLSEQNNHYVLHTHSGEKTCTHLVLANAYAAQQLYPSGYFNLKNIRGQLSFLDAQLTPKLNAVISGRNYLAPAQYGRMCLGATFDPDDIHPDLREKDHLRNLDALSDYGAPWQRLKELGLQAIVGGRVGFRACAPDYLPVVGAVPETEKFKEDFAALRKDSKHIPKIPAPMKKGLWVNLGHGAKGVATTPLCAEILASLICADSLPVPQDIYEALWPGRFIVRDMARGKI